MSLRKTLLIITLVALSAGCNRAAERDSYPNQQAGTSDVNAASSSIADESIPISLGKVTTIDSQILEESRDIWIYVPESSSEPENIGFKYPVIYLLDGNFHFHYVASLIRQMSSFGGVSHIPEMIVVGIPNTDRLRDLTPSHMTGTSGGGRQFISFIEAELIPFIESNYPSSGYRTFIGHSLGGLMVVDTLIEKPELFANYIVIDPSLWWDNQLLVERAKVSLTLPAYKDKSLYLAVANTMLRLTTIDQVGNDQDDRTQHIRSILEFAELTESYTENGLNFSWQYYADEGHVTLPMIAEHDALRFLFEWFSWWELSEIIVTDTSTSGDQLVSSIVSHYERISVNLGQRYLPPQGAVNSWGQMFLQSDRPEAALEFFRLNTQNYPESYRVHESMGDYYAAISEREMAYASYSRALELGGNESILEKLGGVAAQ